MKRSKAWSQQALYEVQLQVICELLDDLMRVVSEPIQFHSISSAELLEFQEEMEMQQALNNIKDAVFRLTGKPYVDRFLDDDVSCIWPVRNRIYGSLNKQPVYKRIVIMMKEIFKPLSWLKKLSCHQRNNMCSHNHWFQLFLFSMKTKLRKM
jgi:hypothetical protein